MSSCAFRSFVTSSFVVVSSLCVYICVNNNLSVTLCVDFKLRCIELKQLPSVDKYNSVDLTECAEIFVKFKV